MQSACQAPHLRDFDVRLYAELYTRAFDHWQPYNAQEWGAALTRSRETIYRAVHRLQAAGYLELRSSRHSGHALKEARIITPIGTREQ